MMAKSVTKSDIQKKGMIAALEESLGIVSTACESMKISRQTHYRWLSQDKEYKMACDELMNMTLDFAESQLHGLIKNGNTAAIIFFLKTKGKERGYVERQEVKVQQDKPDLSGYSTDQLIDLVANTTLKIDD
jgi:hypothetical protein